MRNLFARYNDTYVEHIVDRYWDKYNKNTAKRIESDIRSLRDDDDENANEIIKRLRDKLADDEEKERAEKDRHVDYFSSANRTRRLARELIRVAREIEAMDRVADAKEAVSRLQHYLNSYLPQTLAEVKSEYIEEAYKNKPELAAKRDREKEIAEKECEKIRDWGTKAAADIYKEVMDNKLDQQWYSTVIQRIEGYEQEFSRSQKVRKVCDAVRNLMDEVFDR